MKWGQRVRTASDAPEKSGKVRCTEALPWAGFRAGRSFARRKSQPTTASLRRDEMGASAQVLGRPIGDPAEPTAAAAARRHNSWERWHPCRPRGRMGLVEGVGRACRDGLRRVARLRYASAPRAEIRPIRTKMKKRRTLKMALREADETRRQECRRERAGSPRYLFHVEKSIYPTKTDQK